MAFLSLSIDRLTIADLERERLILGRATLDEVLADRIQIGLREIRAGGAPFDWHPIHASAILVDITISDDLAEQLEGAAHGIGFPIEVVAATFAVSEFCKSSELLELEFQASWRTRAANSSRVLRAEPGRGNIYAAHFELPGYQLVFLGLLAGGRVSQSAVVEEAILALAGQVCASNSVAGRPLTPEARDLATRMVAISGQKRARNGKVSKAHGR